MRKRLPKNWKGPLSHARGTTRPNTASLFHINEYKTHLLLLRLEATMLTLRGKSAPQSLPIQYGWTPCAGPNFHKGRSIRPKEMRESDWLQCHESTNDRIQRKIYMISSPQRHKLWLVSRFAASCPFRAYRGSVHFFYTWMWRFNIYVVRCTQNKQTHTTREWIEGGKLVHLRTNSWATRVRVTCISMDSSYSSTQRAP